MNVASGNRTGEPGRRHGFRSLVAPLSRAASGGHISDESWQARHRVLAGVLSPAGVVLVALALLDGDSPAFAVVTALGTSAMGIGARLARARRTLASCLTTVAHLTLAAAFVHVADGRTEAHVAFVVAVGLITLYQSLALCTLAVALAVAHHLVVGLAAPETVYDHTAGADHPFLWALMHGVILVVASAVNIAAWKLNQGQAHLDPVTKLSTRARIEEQIAAVSRTGQPSAVLAIEICGFEHYITRFGHLAGEDLVRVVGHEARDVVGCRDCVARLEGGRLAVLTSVRGERDARAVAQRIVHAVSARVPGDGSPPSPAVNVGVGFAGGRSPDSPLHQAELAVAAASRTGSGRARVEVFAPILATSPVRTAGLALDLRHAIERGQLELHYQPIVTLLDERLVGFEALVRWTHPERGMIAPDGFIPLAEASGLINEIGQWVLDTALCQLRDWDRYVSEPFVPTMHVNVSPLQLACPTFAASVRRSLVSCPLAPARLVLEVTESSLSGPAALTSIADLRRLGVRIAVDDFGTGDASLSYLQSVEVDLIKVDRCFTEAIGDKYDGLIAGILALASRLELATIVEGVERRDQVNSLVLYGANLAQGHLFHRPLTGERAGELLRHTSLQRAFERRNTIAC